MFKDSLFAGSGAWLTHVLPFVFKGNHFGLLEVTNRKAKSAPSWRMAATNPLVVTLCALG